VHCWPIRYIRHLHASTDIPKCLQSHLVNFGMPSALHTMMYLQYPGGIHPRQSVKLGRPRQCSSSATLQYCVSRHGPTRRDERASGFYFQNSKSICSTSAWDTTQGGSYVACGCTWSLKCIQISLPSICHRIAPPWKTTLTPTRHLQKQAMTGSL
jgi:hypothetical protein